jgi:ABC-type phosphate/phosphonate transport system substrate-binding protein
VEKGWVAACGIGLALLVPGGARAQARFITVDQGPDELAADVVLAEELGRTLVAQPKTEGYKAVIDDLVADNASEGTVARVTPYAFVVAEMLGAKLDLIATCRSRASGTTTYGAYLVVRRSDVPAPAHTAALTPAQVKEFLQARSASGQPAKFVYHDRFSTSSYFLPSLYFRRQRVFAGKPDATEKDISAIRVERLEDRSSSDLVVAVAEGSADVASVWDGTRSKFLRDPKLASAASKVWFIRLQNNLPDDLLVVTRSARGIATAIRSRLAAPGGERAYPETSDVNGWVLWTDNAAEEARTALSELRRQAAASALPVVVDVRASSDAPAPDGEVEAVRQALRLAGTELVAKGESADYRNVDVVWELARIHDEAVRLLVRYDHFRYTPTGQDVTQQFDLSFKDLPDLTRRASLLVTTRMHRIRPVWLYWDAAPTVIRDVAFDPSRQVPVQEILWKNPRRNDYQVLEHKVAGLETSDFNKLVLAKADLSDLSFEPMGRRAVRVLLVRPSRERPLFTALTVVFVALFVLAAAGFAWDAWPRGSLSSEARAEAPRPDLAVPAPALAPIADGHAPALTGRA